MINNIYNLLKNVSLSQREGRFLSDKSYAYDDIYFMSKYIIETVDNALIFNKSKEETRYEEYIKDIFQLRGLASGAGNYMSEALNLLTYSGVLEKIDRDQFKVKNVQILNFITERVENAYIFLYLIVFKTFENEGLLSIYEQFLYSKEQSKKEALLNEILQIFKEKSVSIGGRNFGENTNWSKQLVKYPVTVLGYANNGDYVARTLHLQIVDNRFKKVDIKDISINIEGTRTNTNSKKINDYIFSFDKNYVVYNLKDYLLTNIPIENYVPAPLNHIAEDLASLKIEKIIKETNQQEYSSKYEQNQFIERKVKTRNNNIQKSFKEGLLKNNAHKCPICGFEYEDFLVASHIKPYAKCDDTYDAINNYNGFLMCPNHDKLFEGAKLMTIDANSGQIILSKDVIKSKDFGFLNGQFIDKTLVDCERRHYLKWHNEQFKLLNK